MNQASGFFLPTTSASPGMLSFVKNENSPTTCAADAVATVAAVLQSLVLSLTALSSSTTGRHGFDDCIKEIRDALHRVQTLTACASPSGSISSSLSADIADSAASGGSLAVLSSSLLASPCSLPISIRHLAGSPELPEPIHQHLQPASSSPLQNLCLAEVVDFNSVAHDWPAISTGNRVVVAPGVRTERRAARASRARSFRACNGWVALVRAFLRRDQGDMCVAECASIFARLVVFRQVPSMLCLRSSRAAITLQSAARRMFFARAEIVRRKARLALSHSRCEAGWLATRRARCDWRMNHPWVCSTSSLCMVEYPPLLILEGLR